MGGTLGELEDELRFVRYGLAGCEPGDLLAVDVPVAAAGPEAAIWAKQGEPAGVFLDDAQQWLTVALVPHVLAVPDEWSLRLERCERIPGSYVWCAVATVPGQPRPREIEVYRCKRYEVRQLTARLAALGWERVAAQPHDDPLAGELHLYRRRAEPSRPSRGRR